jgi:hypothetical protein
MQADYGLGILTITPTGVTNPTPVQVGLLQDVGVEIDGAVEYLYGPNQFPVDAAIGKRKINVTAKSGVIGSQTVGAVLGLAASAIVVGSKFGTTPYESCQVATNTYTVAGGANFFEDLGVINTVTGLAMTRVASAPTAGQYSVVTSTGVYTFAAADSNPLVLISYSTTAAAAGKTINYTNQPMGAAPTFTLNLFNSYRAKTRGLRLPAVIFPKLKFDFKQDGFTNADLELTALQDSAGNVGYWWSTE